MDEAERNTVHKGLLIFQARKLALRREHFASPIAFHLFPDEQRANPTYLGANITCVTLCARIFTIVHLLV
jgi:hypothetical protein